MKVAFEACTINDSVHAIATAIYFDTTAKSLSHWHFWGYCSINCCGYSMHPLNKCISFHWNLSKTIIIKRVTPFKLGLLQKIDLQNTQTLKLNQNGNYLQK